MNREQRRNYIKKLKKYGITGERAKQIASEIKQFSVGDKVKLDYKSIFSRKKDKMNPLYLEFVEQNKDKVFTVCISDVPGLYALEEDENENKWLFTPYDLILCEDQQ